MKVSLLRRLWVLFAVSVFNIYASKVNRLKVSGVDNVPSTGGVLIASNHISPFETVLLPTAVLLKYKLSMVWAPAKEELFRNRIAGAFFRSLGAFPVNRGRDVRAASRINELLKTERVMLFPEGTRHKDGVLGKANRGVGKIIYDTKVAVVPTALIGLNRWQPVGSGQEGEIVFGKVLDISDLFILEDNKVTHQLIADRVMLAIADLLKSRGAYVDQS